VNRRRTVALLAVAALATLTTGCGGHASGSAQKLSTSPASPTASPTPLLTPTAPPGTALGAGQRVWAAFSERGLAYDAWWARLKPQLSDAARATYVYDDPRNIPAMTLTGTIRVAAKPPAQPHFTSEVVVPTDKGVFRLDLERHTRTSPWLLYAIRFPASVQ
jgi:hypothetical protein